jgi:DNA-binding NarL/FixJ family response regulator
MVDETVPIRILLADDHPFLRAGIRAELAEEDDILVVGEAGTGNEVMTLCANLMVDVLVLDLSMPGPPPRETVAFLKQHCPEMKILVLTAYQEEAYIRGMLALGVKGYLLKDEATEALVDAIHAVQRGEHWFSQPVLEKMAAGFGSDPHEMPLTTRELEILKLLRQGMTNKEIAYQLRIAERTVRYHVENLLEKLQALNRAEAVANAIQKGWLPVES